MSRSPIDRAIARSTSIAAGCSALIVLAIVAFLARDAWPILVDPAARATLFSTTWSPAEGRFGMGPMLAGSAAVTVGAILLAAPLGVGLAVYAHELASPTIARGCRAVVELLAGVPSVVFGIFALDFVVPAIASIRPPGQSLLAGIIVLAVMILPTITVAADAALAGIPADLRRAAAALGLGPAEAALNVHLPAARRGVAAGIALSIGRAIGETMAVLMVCGNVVAWPDSLFTPIRTLTANIALEMAYAQDLHRAALFAGGCLLVVAFAAFGLLAREDSSIRGAGA